MLLLVGPLRLLLDNFSHFCLYFFGFERELLYHGSVTIY
jgi:hypothetical protein